MAPVAYRLSSRVKVLLTVLLAVLATSTQAWAQGPGVRGGVSIDPDQFYFGGQVETAPLVDRLRFRPNLELGVGSDATLAAFNFEFVYPFLSRQAWHAYAGAGPALNWFNINDRSDTEAGFNMLVGLEHSRGLFFEVKLGVFDSPDVKFGVGYTFSR